MKIKDLISELEDNSFFKKFKLENPSSFFSAGFLILDLKEKSETIQLDFFLPEENKIAAFEHPYKEPKIFEDKISEMKPQTTDIKIDINDLEVTCKTIIEKNNSSVNPTKIISILKDNQWNLTCMDDMLGIVRIKLDAISGEQISFDKGSLMDFMGIKKK